MFEYILKNVIVFLIKNINFLYFIGQYSGTEH